MDVFQRLLTTTNSLPYQVISQLFKLRARKVNVEMLNTIRVSVYVRDVDVYYLKSGEGYLSPLRGFFEANSRNFIRGEINTMLFLKLVN